MVSYKSYSVTLVGVYSLCVICLREEADRTENIG